ncbi:MAG: glycosyltransferase, partial [Methylomarinum sp.]|nr:glycosyltransferase [Methylomarinum sp.]
IITNPLILVGMSCLEWLSYHSANRCIGLSPGIVEGIKKRGVKSNKIALVPNGCDLSIFGAEAKRWRPEGVNKTDLMAIFTGTHGVANGLNAALDAAKELKVRGREDIKLVFVGQGKLKPQLQERAKKESLDNVFFHSPVNKEKLAGLMASADVGMQLLSNTPAFYFGTSPNKFFDYISSGLPVLNNYPGWLSEMIKDNNCGYSVVPDDAKAFADALVDAAGNRDRLLVMGGSSKALAQREFSRQDLADKWVDWLEGVGI